jgi:hypothetical protein
LREDVTTPALSSHEKPDVPDPLTVVLSEASNHPINPEFIKGLNGATVADGKLYIGCVVGKSGTALAPPIVG